MRRLSRHAFWPVAAMMATLAAPAAADPVAEAVEEVSEQVEGSAEAETETKKRSILVVPIPQSSPTLGTGVTAVGAVFYNPNQSPEPWITGVGAMYTSNGSKAIGAMHKMALADDKFRITAFVGFADVNLRFYGTGPAAGERDLSIELNERGYATMLQGQVEIASHLYAGARVTYLDLDTTIIRSEPLFPDAEIPRRAFNAKLLLAGPMLTYDTRDSSLNPKTGEMISVTSMISEPALGSDFEYQTLNFAANAYRSLGPNTVIAARGALCAVSSSTPFFDQCMFGASSDLRGYETGRYRDMASWATQVELRQHLFWRLGAVVFAGIGGTAPSLGSLDETEFLPAAGVGLRFMPVPSAGVNMRIDFAVGNGSHALYVSLGEAF